MIVSLFEKRTRCSTEVTASQAAAFRLRLLARPAASKTLRVDQRFDPPKTPRSRSPPWQPVPFMRRRRCRFVKQPAGCTIDDSSSVVRRHRPQCLWLFVFPPRAAHAATPALAHQSRPPGQSLPVSPPRFHRPPCVRRMRARGNDDPAGSNTLQHPLGDQWIRPSPAANHSYQTGVSLRSTTGLSLSALQSA